MSEKKMKKMETKDVVFHPLSLTDICGKIVVLFFANEPDGFISKYPHLVPLLVKFLPYYSIKAQRAIRSNPSLVDLLPNYFTFAKNLELYETKYLEISRKQIELMQLDDPLVDIFQDIESFYLEPADMVAPLDERLYFSSKEPLHVKDTSSKIRSVVDKETFLERFHIFTNNQLKDWNDWSNMIVIGGAVFAALLPLPEDIKTEVEISEYYHNKQYPSSDIDIYFYGLSPSEFHKKFEKLYNHLKDLNKYTFMVQSPLTLTIISTYPSRMIQIVTGKWDSLEQILLEPDVDCSCVGYNGNTVITTYRGQASFNTRCIVCSPKRAALRPFPEYESRLVKYSQRGFWLVDAKLKWDIISKEGVKHTADRMMQENKKDNGVGMSPFLSIQLLFFDDLIETVQIPGLKILVAGFCYPEARKMSPLFKSPSFPEEGLAYGPTWTVTKIKIQMKQKVHVTSPYGYYDVDSVYTLVTEKELAKMQIQLRDIEDEQRHHTWYDSWDFIKPVNVDSD